MWRRPPCWDRRRERRFTAQLPSGQCGHDVGGSVAMHPCLAALVEGRNKSDRYITIACPAKVCNDVWVRVRVGVPRSTNQAILALVGAALVVGCAVQVVRGALSLSWPKADGVVAYSQYMRGRRAIGVDIRYRYTT